MLHTLTKEFTYNNLNHNFQYEIEIPYIGDVRELTYILLSKHGIPNSCDVDLSNELSKFIQDANQEYYDNESSTLISSHDNNFDDVTKEWESVMREEMAEYGDQRCATDEELFATAYHKMVHSPALETMLQLESSYANIVRKKCEKKKKQIEELSNDQAKEMNDAVERLEKDITESDINTLASQHFERQTLLQTKLTSELDAIKETQRREYREWLMQMLEEKQTNSSLPNSPLSPVAMMPSISRSYSSDSTTSTLLEESFTIHLGSQLKQMHNIRVLAANVMDLCAIVDNEQQEIIPQTLQTALNLYSNDLHGLVLIADNIIGSRLTQNFRDICLSSTEFHFNNIDSQLDKICLIRQQYKSQVDSDRKNTNHLQQGDFYMTKHSNLSQVHVIFHIVADDSIKASDINSRHQVVLGLRNILKTACSYDITTLTIPLLLSYEMTEEMTILWCEKRAELIFKCIKGFMIEMASWGGSDLKNLQFMLPQDISSEVFQSLTDMLPRIFKVSNPLVLS